MDGLVDGQRKALRGVWQDPIRSRYGERVGAGLPAAGVPLSTPAELKVTPLGILQFR